MRHECHLANLMMMVKKKMDPLYCKGDESRYIFTQGKLSLTHNALIEP